MRSIMQYVLQITVLQITDNILQNITCFEQHLSGLVMF